jgi:hypothetical protein
LTSENALFSPRGRMTSPSEAQNHIDLDLAVQDFALKSEEAA